MSVNLMFFAAVATLARKEFGNRAVTVDHWNAMIAALGEFQRVYLTAEQLPGPENVPHAEDTEDELEDLP